MTQTSIREQQIALTERMKLLEELAQMAKATSQRFARGEIKDPFLDYLDSLSTVTQELMTRIKRLGADMKKEENHDDI